MLQAVQNCFFFLIHWKCWKALVGGAVNHNSQKKYGRMVVEQDTSSFTVSAPEGPAGADMRSQPSLARVRRHVNGQNKYFKSIYGHCEQVRRLNLSLQFRDVNWVPSWATGFHCNLEWVVYSLDVQTQSLVALWEVSLLPCPCPAGDLGPNMSCPWV